LLRTLRLGIFDRALQFIALLLQIAFPQALVLLLDL
jgi:hypothetical protein